MKKSFLISPIIYALLPTLVLYSHNVREAWPILILRPLIYSLLFAVMSWLGALLIFRNKDKASIMTSIWLVLFFSYGHAYLTADKLGIFHYSPVGPHLLLMGSYLALLLIAFSLLLFTKKTLSPVVTFFNIASITLLLINAGQLLPFEINRFYKLRVLKQYMAEQHLKDAPSQNTQLETYPDIYYFVFDRYASQSMLSEYFGHDNTPFLTSLEEQGFYVANQSIANYPTTFLSLSSSLNMTHLTFLDTVLGKNYSDQSVIYKELINDNETAQFLKKRGYAFYQLGSSWEPTKQNTLATANYNLFLDLNEFELFLYENTLLNAVMGKVQGQQVFTGVRILEIKSANALYKKQQLETLAENPGPKFVFAHFLLPHPPYLYADDCHALSFEEVRSRSSEVGYLDQLKCANKIMSDVSAYIIEKKSDRPVVIILQSDEGPYLPDEYFNDTRFIDTPNKDAYKIHARILNTLYLSDKNDPQKVADYTRLGFTPNATPVNTFRRVFNYYFGTEYPLLEDRSYIFTDSNRPYDFTEITEFARYQTATEPSKNPKE
jgi:hypothetical protein